MRIRKFRDIDFSGWVFDRFFMYSNKYRILLLGWFYKFTIKIKGVKYGRHLVLNGRPLIHRMQDSKINIGHSCIINSARNADVTGLVRRCALVTDRKNAEITIGDNSGITASLFVAISRITVGRNVLIGAYCTIVDNDFHDTNPKRRNENNYEGRPITIEDNVFIGFNCFILKGVTIGENSVIGANSVVVSNIPKNSIAMGNPCKVVLRKNWD
jgi:acetyltransferase-like isoleucine patch superfamily enzyme